MTPLLVIVGLFALAGWGCAIWLWREGERADAAWAAELGHERAVNEMQSRWLDAMVDALSSQPIPLVVRRQWTRRLTQGKLPGWTVPRDRSGSGDGG